MNKENTPELTTCLIIQSNKKRRWDEFKKIMAEHGNEYHKGEEVPYLEITADCCGDTLIINEEKDFPSEDVVMCKCGKTKIFEWIETQEELN